ncbi:MAG: hypothetical protein HQL42_13225 [Alphaproteobacteria bacterium]|nr:hypothetical protein [Alphaproteobacteria bacterium]
MSMPDAAAEMATLFPTLPHQAQAGLLAAARAIRSCMPSAGRIEDRPHVQTIRSLNPVEAWWLAAVTAGHFDTMAAWWQEQVAETELYLDFRVWASAHGTKTYARSAWLHALCRLMPPEWQLRLGKTVTIDGRVNSLALPPLDACRIGTARRTSGAA